MKCLSKFFFFFLEKDPKVTESYFYITEKDQSIKKKNGISYLFFPKMNCSSVISIHYPYPLILTGLWRRCGVLVSTSHPGRGTVRLGKVASSAQEIECTKTRGQDSRKLCHGRKRKLKLQSMGANKSDQRAMLLEFLTFLTFLKIFTFVIIGLIFLNNVSLFSDIWLVQK